MASPPPRTRPRRPPTRAPSRRRRRRRRLELAGQDRRLRFAAAVMALLTAIILGRLVLLQGLDGTAYAAAASAERLREDVLPATRGQILDANGNPLAYTVSARKIYADPFLISDPVGAATILSGLLTVPVNRLVDKMQADNRYQVLAERLEPSLAAQVMGLGIAGIGVEVQPLRVYPAESVGAQVVGFTGADGSGLAGIEQAFDELLTGTPGTASYEVGRTGAVIPAGVHADRPAVPGGTVRLTIDQDVQFHLQRQLDAQCADGSTENAQGVILEAHTGRVLAMATCRGFDPNSANDADPDTLGNGAISGILESGSVAKAITLSAAIEEGLVTPDDVRLTPDSITVGNTTVRDAHPHDPINYTITGILAKSSNVGTIGIARELGNERLEEYLRKFGVGAPTGIELPGESPGILVPHQEWSIAQSINIPIGQGFALTTLQMASIYQTIANGGVRIPPRIVASTTAPDGTVTDTVQPEGVRVISEEAAATMAYMLEAVVGEGGTALNASIGGYRVAGKTGTAQRPNPACRCYAGGGFWTTFAGFAPADAPRYVMSVMLQRPDSGVPAGPVFKNVMTFVLAHEAVAPTGAARPEFILIV
ncbi:MAG: penicillin-binding protein 2 [Geodermatophilaceae bacterium]|nr:penicillin-binding protein 2 [Geodermatophilaceae bacterium]